MGSISYRKTGTKQLGGGLRETDDLEQKADPLSPKIKAPAAYGVRAPKVTSREKQETWTMRRTKERKLEKEG